MNKLWVCRSTAENIARAEKYEYFKANEKYCLVITDDTPEKMAKVTDDAAKSLTVQDWTWITAVGAKIKAEQEYKAFQEEQKSFLNALKKNSSNRKRD